MLEVLLTMVLLVLVVTSFAVVYPSGFRLHRKNQMSTQAGQLARSVLSELKSLPLTREDGGLSLAYLALNGYSGEDSTMDDFPRTELTDNYRLADDEGIRVRLYDLQGGGDSSVYATMSVTIVYDDPYRNRETPVSLTLSGGKSWNR